MNNEIIIYIGCYATLPQNGIYAYSLNAESGDLTKLFASNAISNPSYLALSSDKGRLYSVMEDDAYQGMSGGGVAAFNIKDNALSLINTMGTKGDAPCHVLIDEKNGFIFTSNYSGGSVSMFPLNSDGLIGELSDLKQHKASDSSSSVPHLHFSCLTGDGSALYAVDLGLDVIKYYEIETRARALISIPSLDIHLPLGSGPRHFISDSFNPDILYIICELSSEIIVVNCKQKQIIQRISTLDSDAKSYCAAIKLSRDGRFLYASNRGDDSVAVFSVAKDNKPLTLIQLIKTQGEYPRDLWLCDDWLLCANQNSNTITQFRRNSKTGKLDFYKTAIELPSPVCVI